MAFTSAVLAQTKASFLLIGPPKYTWQAVCKSQRPCVRFMLQDGELPDYYQGQDRMLNLMCTYWPMSEDHEEKLTPLGCQSLVQVLAKHKCVLVLSAGRGVGWARMMQQVDSVFEERVGSVVGSTMTGSNEKVVNYVAEHYDKFYESYKDMVGECNWSRCSGSWVCNGCLRKIKKFAAIEEKVRPWWWQCASTQTLPQDFFVAGNGEVDEVEYWARHCLQEP